MTGFLIKSSISLVALLAFYHLLLENEKAHRFKPFLSFGFGGGFNDYSFPDF